MHPSLFLPAALISPQAQPAPKPPAPDPFIALRGLPGTWTGVAEGEPGKGTALRTYAFVLKGRFLEERNEHRYAPKEGTGPGEVHEHRGLIGHDRGRKLLVWRQFHPEGFVNQYLERPELGGPGKLVFETEAIENLPAGWRARETLSLEGADAFTETFELSPPGKPFEVYSRTRFTRAASPKP